MPTLNRLLGRLLAVLFVAGVCVFAATSASATASTPAEPCTCTGRTVQDHVKTAAAVFIGTVEEIAAPGGSPASDAARTSTVQVSKVYKGDMINGDTVDVVTTGAFGTCARDLVRGETYVFFVESDEGFIATDCGGTARATTSLITQVERFLGAGRDPVPPEPETATLKPVNTDVPPSLSRVAAPGVALVIIGLLGLAVVRRLARPRS